MYLHSLPIPLTHSNSFIRVSPSNCVLCGLQLLNNTNLQSPLKRNPRPQTETANHKQTQEKDEAKRVGADRRREKDGEKEKCLGQVALTGAVDTLTHSHTHATAYSLSIFNYENNKKTFPFGLTWTLALLISERWVRGLLVLVGCASSALQSIDLGASSRGSFPSPPLCSCYFPDNNYTSIHFTFSIILCTASSSSQLILSFDLSPHLIFDLVLCRNPLSKTCSLISSASYCRQFGHFVLFLTATATTTATCFMSNLFSQELLCNWNWFNGNWLNSRRRNEKFCIR